MSARVVDVDCIARGGVHAWWNDAVHGWRCARCGVVAHPVDTVEPDAPGAGGISDIEMFDEIAVWVDCELGAERCTGGDYACDMVPDQGGWICPSCDASERAAWEETHTPYAMNLR